MQTPEKGGRVGFSVHVRSRASREEIAGEYQVKLKVRLTALPVDRRRNKALRKLLAARLKVPLAAVRIASGLRSRTKRVENSGVTGAMIRALAG
jgi:uncharacterized protein YggU (UPF0235/DUF167 family)